MIHVKLLTEEAGQISAAILIAKVKNAQPITQADFDGLKTRLPGVIAARLLEWEQQEQALLAESERLKDAEKTPLSAAFRASLHQSRGGAA